VSPHRDEHLELCAGYVLDALSTVEKRTLEGHLAEGCTVCDAEIERLGRGAWLLAASSPPHRAPAALRGRVLRAVRAEIPPRPARQAQPDTSRTSRRSLVPAWAWAAAAALMAVVGFLQWRTATRLESELAGTRAEVERLRLVVEDEKSWASVATAPDARVVQLGPTPEGAPRLAARVTYDPTTRRALVAVSNFTPPAGKDYQLWAILDTGPSSLGVVRPGSTGGTVLRLTDVGDPAKIAAFAVSLENEGGSPTPNAPAGPVVMIGKIEG
jgi:anti-sigma-K factor RskA